MRGVYMTTSMSIGDSYPYYSFGIYDDVDGEIIINMEDEVVKKHTKDYLSWMEMDQMTKEEINDWYERYGHYCDID